MLVYPDYYNDFSCIAGACKHNCCVGWEIDVDPDTLALYKQVPGEFGERLRANITDAVTPCFKLSDGERCPFLNEENLCDIIINLGEESLCQICSDHPRFVNFIGDREEIGLGLCCEAAAKLILNRKERVRLILQGESMEQTAEQKHLLTLRDIYIEDLQNRELPLTGRFELCFGKSTERLTRWKPCEIKRLLIPLERLEPSWDNYLDRLKESKSYGVIDDKKWQTAFEQLAVYFLYRHFFAEESRAVNAIKFAWFGVCAVAMMFNGESIEELEDVARRFSCEIEYSEENTERLFLNL